MASGVTRLGRRAGQDEMHLEPGVGARGGGEPAVIGPPTPRRDERVRAVGERGTNQEFEIPELVAAERERQQVLALDPQFHPAAEGRLESLETMERARLGEQAVAWQGGDGRVHRSMVAA